MSIEVEQEIWGLGAQRNETRCAESLLVLNLPLGSTYRPKMRPAPQISLFQPFDLDNVPFRTKPLMFESECDWACDGVLHCRMQYLEGEQHPIVTRCMWRMVYGSAIKNPQASAYEPCRTYAYLIEYKATVVVQNQHGWYILWIIGYIHTNMYVEQVTMRGFPLCPSKLAQFSAT